MFELGGLLDPFGRLWGASIALALLAILPDKMVVPSGWTRKMLRVLVLLLSLMAAIFAVVATALVPKAVALSWSVGTSTLIHAAIFLFVGRLGSAIGHRIRKRAPSDDSQPSGDGT
ncbi:MAG: hypothetical protein M3R13_03865 [Armatimonadota bacterium]|nr:hypothetical protein [Armatimonadota bacterium]